MKMNEWMRNGQWCKWRRVALAIDFRQVAICKLPSNRWNSRWSPSRADSWLSRSGTRNRRDCFGSAQEQRPCCCCWADREVLTGAESETRTVVAAEWPLVAKGWAWSRSIREETVAESWSKSFSEDNFIKRRSSSWCFSLRIRLFTTWGVEANDASVHD